MATTKNKLTKTQGVKSVNESNNRIAELTKIINVLYEEIKHIKKVIDNQDKEMAELKQGSLRIIGKQEYALNQSDIFIKKTKEYLDGIIKMRDAEKESYEEDLKTSYYFGIVIGMIIMVMIAVLSFAMVSWFHA